MTWLSPPRLALDGRAPGAPETSRDRVVWAPQPRTHADQEPIDGEKRARHGKWRWEASMALARREGFGFELPDVFRRLFEGQPESGGWLRAEERREGNDIVVRFELPGVDPEHDVEISVVDGVLHVRAERQEKSERRDDAGYRSEFRYGSFVRNVALPSGVDADDIR